MTFRNHNLARVALALAGLAIAATMLAPDGRGQAPPAAAAEGAGAVQGYPVAEGDVAQLAAQLSQRYANQPDVRIVGDPRTRQIVAVAPPEVQREIAAWIAENARPGAQPAAMPVPAPPVPTAAPNNAPSSGPVTKQTLDLKHVSPTQFEQQVLRIWGSRVAAKTSPEGEVTDFEFAAGTGSRLQVDHRLLQVTVQTPAATAQSWLRVLQAIDAPQAGGEQSEIVTLDRADPATIVRAVSLIRAAAAADLPPSVSPHRKQHIGQFVGMLFQPEAAAQPAPQPAPPAAPMPPADPPAAAADETEGKIGNVRIEIIEGLDQIIVIGKKKDVERVLKIIEEIEQQSQENRPAVEVYPLKQVDGEALATLIQTIYPDVFGARQGRVTITPLLKPNVLLLIGRKENIPPVIELIQKLDRPTPPNAQVRVFPLKHMSAIDAERTVRSFFVIRPGVTNDVRAGLGTRVLVIAEYRTNSLIVQAAPRDMLEVAKLIEQLDVEASASTQEVQVFKLKNALAEELAPVLQEAITGQGVPASNNSNNSSKPALPAERARPRRPRRRGGPRACNC